MTGVIILNSETPEDLNARSSRFSILARTSGRRSWAPEDLPGETFATGYIPDFGTGTASRS